jgi:hypothetical protein
MRAQRHCLGRRPPARPPARPGRRCLPFDKLQPKAEDAGLAMPEQPPAKRRRVGGSGGGRAGPDAVLAEV